jgi:hypothetical protein
MSHQLDDAVIAPSDINHIVARHRNVEQFISGVKNQLERSLRWPSALQ